MPNERPNSSKLEVFENCLNNAKARLIFNVKNKGRTMLQNSPQKHQAMPYLSISDSIPLQSRRDALEHQHAGQDAKGCMRDAQPRGKNLKSTLRCEGGAHLAAAPHVRQKQPIPEGYAPYPSSSPRCIERKGISPKPETRREHKM
eukprot:4490696-Amphidinium_carterae.1